MAFLNMGIKAEGGIFGLGEVDDPTVDVDQHGDPKVDVGSAWKMLSYFLLFLENS